MKSFPYWSPPSYSPQKTTKNYMTADKTGDSKKLRHTVGATANETERLKVTLDQKE
jgi:hypothetical protein